MARQDDWVKLQVRLPKALHQKLQDCTYGSMNAEIVQRLEESFDEQAKEALVRFELEAAQKPLTWEEIGAETEKLLASLPPKFQGAVIQVVTPGMEVTATKRVQVTIQEGPKTVRNFGAQEAKRDK